MIIKTNIKDSLEANGIDTEELENYLQYNFPISEIKSVKLLTTVFHIKFVSKSGLDYDVTLKRRNFTKKGE